MTRTRFFGTILAAIVGPRLAVAWKLPCPAYDNFVAQELAAKWYNRKALDVLMRNFKFRYYSVTYEAKDIKPYYRFKS